MYTVEETLLTSLFGGTWFVSVLGASQSLLGRQGDSGKVYNVMYVPQYLVKHLLNLLNPFQLWECCQDLT